MDSHRTDGRGHWPAGVPRNVKPRGWTMLLRRVRRLLSHPEFTHGVDPTKHPKRSRNGLAAWVGVDQRTLRRWLAGEDLPTDPTVVERIREWANNVD